MREEELRKEIEDFFKSKLNEWKLDSFFDVGKTNVLTDFTIAPNENGKFQLYAGFLEQDIAIYLKDKHVNLSGDVELFRADKIRIPLVIAEVKLAKNFDTHQLITYSAIASKIKTLFPDCIYFMLIKGKREFRRITLKRHAKSVEVFDDWDSQREQVAEKIEKHIRQFARSVKPKREKKHTAPTDEEMLAALVAVYKKTGKPAISRQISDELGIEDPDFGRGAVRAAMKRLMAAGKVIGEKATEGRAALVYKPA